MTSPVLQVALATLPLGAAALFAALLGAAVRRKVDGWVGGGEEVAVGIQVNRRCKLHKEHAWSVRSAPLIKKSWGCSPAGCLVAGLGGGGLAGCGLGEGDTPAGAVVGLTGGLGEGVTPAGAVVGLTGGLAEGEAPAGAVVGGLAGGLTGGGLVDGFGAGLGAGLGASFSQAPL